MALVTSNEYPGDRLVVWCNPLRAEHAARTREELMEATEERLNAFVKVTRRKRDPLRGIHEFSLRVVAILGKCKMNKHFRVYVTETSFSYDQRQYMMAPATIKF